MVMPKEENTTEGVEEEVQGTVSTIDLISRINSLQVLIRLVHLNNVFMSLRRSSNPIMKEA